ncbi:hypothetical protein PUN28_007594 [Cardiocondyla obscurior]|uniref:Uncharacterized protein n=1 Tax=Cardiocondyla obscurior TaxID=286306 RepID=A0AAW2G739_9HYME
MRENTLIYVCSVERKRKKQAREESCFAQENLSFRKIDATVAKGQREKRRVNEDAEGTGGARKGEKETDAGSRPPPTPPLSPRGPPRLAAAVRAPSQPSAATPTREPPSNHPPGGNPTGYVSTPSERIDRDSADPTIARPGTRSRHPAAHDFRLSLSEMLCTSESREAGRVSCFPLPLRPFFFFHPRICGRRRLVGI